MHGADVGDDGNVGPCQTGEPGKLSGVVHAHLDHSRLRRGVQLQQRPGNADLVVEVLSRPLGPVDGGAGRGGHFLGRGFAHAPGQSDEAGVRQRGAPPGGDLLQGGQTVGDDDHRHAGELPLAQRRGGSGLHGLADEVVSVPRGPQGHEELTRPKLPRVVLGALKGDVLIFR